MAISEKSKLVYKFSCFIIFIFLVLFPLGQLLRIQFIFLSKTIVLEPIDLIAAFSLPLLFIKNYEKPKFLNHINGLLLVLFFSWILAIPLFGISGSFLGLLYFLRVIIYTSFFVSVWNFVKENEKNKKIIINSIVLITLVISIFGWIQYFFYPDLRSLKYIGWDDHFFRLVSTFLDPGYTGIILVVGTLVTILKYSENKDKNILLLTFFFLTTIAFTYARASYVALAVGLFILFFTTKIKKVLIIVGLVFLFILPVLPRPGGEGVKLERTQSVENRFQNYIDTLTIIKKYPLLGVGFNNICIARTKILDQKSIGSHSCSGADSSLLLLLATTGVVGFFNIIYRF